MPDDPVHDRARAPISAGHHSGVLAAVLVLALTVLPKAVGASDDPDQARWESLNQQAIQLHQQGKMKDAADLFEQLVPLAVKVFGPVDSHVATSLNNLAVLCRAMGRYAEAEPLLQRCLKISEARLGPDHPDTATCLGNLAGLYKEMGRDAEADRSSSAASRSMSRGSGPTTPIRPAA